MPEEYTCIECEHLYDYNNGDMNERMCNRCIEKIYDEDGVIDADKNGNLVKSERRNPNIKRSSTVHYPDWDKKNKKYIVRKRIVGKLNKGETTC